MSALMTEPVVARKKKTQPRNDEVIRIRSEVAAKVRIVTAYTGETIADYVSNIIDPIVSKAVVEEQAKYNRDPGRKGKPAT